MKLKTWNEWESLGFHIVKGQKAVAFDKNNIALFADNQVAKTVRYNRAPDVTNSRRVQQYVDEKPETVYYADGSGYVNYGGPCGPLYFDRNGNT